MKRAFLPFMLLSILLASTSAFAQNPANSIANADYMQLGWQEFPIAGIDNLFIPYSNPSLLGTGNANGIGLVHLADKERFQKRYWLMLNGDNLAYTYERDHGKNYHLLATGFEALPAYILPNLYLGTNYRFADGGFEDGVFRSGITYRPHDSSSLAFTLENPMHDRPFYRAGVAVRPLVFVDQMADYRLELSADINYSYMETEGYKIKKPILGINTQVLDGVKLGATYNLEEETALLSFSLGLGKSEVGSMVRAKEHDNYGYAYAFLSEESFKPFLGLKTSKWYQMKARNSVVTYKAPKYKIGPIKIYDKNTQGFEDIAASLKKAQEDPTISGILLINPSYATSFGLQQELVGLFQDFRASGKKVGVYYDNISNGGYIFASAIADKIYLNPMGSLDLRGLSISSPYLKDALNSLGIEAINFRSHKYKNAGNMFSENNMTDAEREVYESLLQNIYDQMLTQINLGRGDKLQKPVQTLVDEGPYFIPQDALDAGLIDGIIYQDELTNTLKQDFGFSTKDTDLADYRSYDWSKPKENLIAVIYASGNIVMGKGIPGQKIAHESTVDLIRKARHNNMYKGIILRVDSGGGSAQASDIILRELSLAQSENKKPVVVSMAGVAASGGYYISAKADRIIADPATLTGSIGVIGLAFNATEMFKKIKVNWGTVKMGENADMGSMYRPWTKAEKDMLESYIEHTYEDFVSKVDAGRKNLSYEEVHALAQGRVWTGEQAKKNGLIDDLGGLDVAMDHMREVSNISGAIRLVDATSSREGINVQFDSKPLMSILGMDTLETISEDYIKVFELWQDFAGEDALMLSPINPEEQQF
ncbi:MAG: signal peptide peptidase SppA [Candidatus Cloacimonetes bacterium]|jgi:protease-4|nr:signal peptide peptidase SppA [Candidatus Cloacimonadota bacterium]MDD2506645.1 signal peptide peptidase SppA [Candidatus Cloacimonadota bacterium]MDD4560380.1 signal peptide peptidase SppA [Candidatus Cloacimonadota bacterium]